MKKTISALAVAGGLLFVTTMPADAGWKTPISDHGQCQNCGIGRWHRSVVYLRGRDGDSGHEHKYRHDISYFPDHYPWVAGTV